MNIDFADVQRIVEKSYQVACNADLPGAADMLSGDGPTQQMGMVRSQVFYALISKLVPTHQVIESHGQVTVSEPPEDWKR